MTKIVSRRKGQRKEFKLRAVELGEGLPSIPRMMEEIEDMRDVLMGRVEPPIDFGLLSLQEYADAYFSRCAEMTLLIQQAEREGNIPAARGQKTGYYAFRTGELRTMMEICKQASQLGSRRITAESLRFEQEMRGRESV